MKKADILQMSEKSDSYAELSQMRKPDVNVKEITQVWTKVQIAAEIKVDTDPEATVQSTENVDEKRGSTPSHTGSPRGLGEGVDAGVNSAPHSLSPWRGSGAVAEVKQPEVGEDESDLLSLCPELTEMDPIDKLPKPIIPKVLERDPPDKLPMPIVSQALEMVSRAGEQVLVKEAQHVQPVQHALEAEDLAQVRHIQHVQHALEVGDLADQVVVREIVRKEESDEPDVRVPVLDAEEAVQLQVTAIEHDEQLLHDAVQGPGCQDAHESHSNPVPAPSHSNPVSAPAHSNPVSAPAHTTPVPIPAHRKASQDLIQTPASGHQATQALNQTPVPGHQSVQLQTQAQISAQVQIQAQVPVQVQDQVQVPFHGQAQVQIPGHHAVQAGGSAQHIQLQKGEACANIPDSNRSNIHGAKQRGVLVNEGDGEPLEADVGDSDDLEEETDIWKSMNSIAVTFKWISWPLLKMRAMMMTLILTVTMMRSLMMGTPASMMKKYSTMGISHTGGLYNILRNDVTNNAGGDVFKPGGSEDNDWVPVNDSKDVADGTPGVCVQVLIETTGVEDDAIAPGSADTGGEVCAHATVDGGGDAHDDSPVMCEDDQCPKLLGRDDFVCVQVQGDKAGGEDDVEVQAPQVQVHALIDEEGDAREIAGARDDDQEPTLIGRNDFVRVQVRGDIGGGEGDANIQEGDRVHAPVNEDGDDDENVGAGLEEPGDAEEGGEVEPTQHENLGSVDIGDNPSDIVAVQAEDPKPAVGSTRQNRRSGKKLDPDLRKETVPEARVAPSEEVPPGQAKGQREVVEGRAHHDDPPWDAAGHEEPGNDEVSGDNDVDMDAIDDQEPPVQVGKVVKDPESEAVKHREQEEHGKQEIDVQVPVLLGGGGLAKSRSRLTFNSVAKRKCPLAA